jgi:hypothetical protein
MAGARFQFANPWRPIGGAIPTQSAAWRLIGGNNRDLGRAPVGYVSSEVSRRAVLHLRAHISDAVPTMSIDSRTSEWTWRLDIGGLIVARSVRGYLRHRECLYNVSHFISTAATAALPGDTALPTGLDAAKAPIATAWAAAVLAIEAANPESAHTHWEAAGGQV